ncbi:MAG TPA: hypothetical protein P5275_10655 [Saprospiraceae bacterium]|nr:hypothetical protein [Saprospiraceae bacterium]MCB9269408.1 hypothetical protein [Lewinellaceae bacterium]HPG06970.1 hypothetical protein [Saprospiraceae bacterium]HPQ98494.1 hypothetical protein [Saprospiraceae bacterium]HQU52571.1 hypothetical protein [Saprospiraceae bacterium]
MSRLFLVKISYLIISLSLIAGCSNELVVETEESRLPVVYGLLDAADSLQLIRIEAALLPVNHGGPDAYLLDSLHRNTQFFEADFGDAASSQLNPLDRILWSQIPEVSKPLAPFSDFIYVTKMQIDPARSYVIVLSDEHGRVASAETSIVEPFAVTQPRTSELLSLNRKIAIRWQSSSNASVYEVAWMVRYIEQTDSGPANLQVLLPQLSTGQISASLEGEAFYQDLAGKLVPLPDGSRTLSGIYLVVVGGSAAYVELQQVLQAGQGITGIQNIPAYSNVEGGLGVFTSRYTSNNGPFQLTGESLDSLQYGTYTRLLGF